MLRVGVGLGVATVTCLAAAANLSIAELRREFFQSAAAVQSFRLEGTVCAVDPGHNLLALQDATASIIMEVPALDKKLQPGDRVRVVANNCPVTQGRFGWQLGTAPVVNNGGRHGDVTKSGQVYLEAGMQPIRVAWFNGLESSMLKVEYEGPGVARMVIPGTALFRKVNQAEGAPSYEAGIDYAAYTGDWFSALPVFENSIPVTNGIATQFDVRYAVRPEKAGLVFDGFIKIVTPGIYTFHVESDDGGWLYAGVPSNACAIERLGPGSPPSPGNYDGGESRTADRWIRLEGVVSFVGQSDADTELEVVTRGGEQFQATIFNELSLRPQQLIRRRVRLTGIMATRPEAELRRKGRLLITSVADLKILEAKDREEHPELADESRLTLINRIRHLTREEASSNLLVRIRGVILWSSPEACIIHDGTGGVYVPYSLGGTDAQPLMGSEWEIEGVTDPGGFSPVVKAQKLTQVQTGAMPIPIHPTAEQLINGSLDAEYVELRGVLTDVSENGFALLTAEGPVRFSQNDHWPMPSLLTAPHAHTLVGSILRMRGCLTARVSTSQSAAEGLRISTAAIEIEAPAPVDPFAVPPRKMADWQAFDPSADALQRTKIQGQILCGNEAEYCVQDGSSGLRVVVKNSEPLKPGDIVAAVGFPRLGGPSPILQESRVQVLGREPLPAPAKLTLADLGNSSHDATLVQADAMLVSDWLGAKQLLELESGPTHFTARLLNEAGGATTLKAGSRVRLTGVYYCLAGTKSGRIRDGFQLWLQNARAIEVLQLPPWWTLRRALLVMGVLATVLCLAFVWIAALRRKVEERTAQLGKEIEARQVQENRRVMEEERTRVAQDLHDELGAGLTEVSILGSLAKNPAVPTAKRDSYLAQLTSLSQTLVTGLDEIVWAVNPRYDSVADMASYYSLFAQRFLNLAGIVCRLRVTDVIPDHPCDSRLRHGIFLPFKEALNNVVRHSRATEVQLEIEVGTDALRIAIRDNGQGFSEPAPAPGRDGIAGMKQRMQKFGGACEIRSKPGHGTTVELRLPLEVKKS